VLHIMYIKGPIPITPLKYFANATKGNLRS
jgi:hypothetical protein